MATNADTTKSRREEARRALAGEERYVALAKKDTETGRRRREAMRAMEGEEHRKRREGKEKLAAGRQASSEALKRKEQAAKEAAAKSAEQKAATERATKEATTTAQKQRLYKITAGEKTIAEIKQSGSVLSPIRTYKSDVASAVKQGGMSITKIAMSEQAKRSNLGITTATGEAGPKVWTRILAWLLTLLLLAAVLASGYLLWENRRNPTPAPIGIRAPTPLIFAENNLAISLDPASGQDGTAAFSVKGAIDAATGENISRGRGITNFYFTKGGEILNLNAFSREAGLRLPDRVARNLKPEFMFGVYNNGQNQARFLILNINAYDQVYAALLEWESGLAADTLPLLYSGQRVNQVAGRQFSDKRIRNADIRLVTDTAGKIFLLYTFLDQDTLLITTSEEAFTKVFERFTNG